LGLWIFAAIAAVGKDERSAIDEGIRATAWILVLLAFYQHFRQGIERPPSAFLNQNVFAGTILMLLPLSLQKKDYFLAVGLLIVLWWEKSVGAWLGFSGALMLARRSAGTSGYRLGVAVGLACFVILYARLESPDVLHRWNWWQAALRMAWERPWFGFGPSSYGSVVCAYQEPSLGLSTLYAHQHFLETAAECGFPYLLVWGAGLGHCLSRGGAHKRFGAVAVLIQSLWDYSLSIPANYWLFCYYAASSISECSRGVNVPARLKLFWGLVVLALGWSACLPAWERWQADRLKAQAMERWEQGASPEEVLSWLERSVHLAPDSEAERMAAEMELVRAQTDSSQIYLEAAAAHLEKAAALNPYRASTRAALEKIGAQLRGEGIDRAKPSQRPRHGTGLRL
jgi:hypothetical protein